MSVRPIHAAAAGAAMPVLLLASSGLAADMGLVGPAPSAPTVIYGTPPQPPVYLVNQGPVIDYPVPPGLAIGAPPGCVDPVVYQYGYYGDILDLRYLPMGPYGYCPYGAWRFRPDQMNAHALMPGRSRQQTSWGPRVIHIPRDAQQAR